MDDDLLGIHKPLIILPHKQRNLITKIRLTKILDKLVVIVLLEE
jgi:hypothetical protein